MAKRKTAPARGSARGAAAGTRGGSSSGKSASVSASSSSHRGGSGKLAGTTALGGTTASGGKSANRGNATARQKTAARTAAAGVHGRSTAGAAGAGKSTRPDDAPARRKSSGASASANAKDGKSSAAPRRADQERRGGLAATSAAGRSHPRTRQTNADLPATRGPTPPAPDAIGLPATRSPGQSPSSSASSAGSLPHGDAGAGNGGGMSQPAAVGAALDADKPADLARPSSAAPLGHDATRRGTDVEGMAG